MKAILAILTIGGGLLACQQASSASDVAASLNQPFTLLSKQAAIVPTSGGNTVRAVLTTVNDSRCPTTVTCVWAGYVGVEVELTDASAASQKVLLSLGVKTGPNATADSALVTLNQQAYWLRLLAVTPYPTGSDDNQTKAATLRLRLR